MPRFVHCKHYACDLWHYLITFVKFDHTYEFVLRLRSQKPAERSSSSAWMRSWWTKHQFTMTFAVSASLNLWTAFWPASHVRPNVLLPVFPQSVSFQIRSHDSATNHHQLKPNSARVSVVQAMARGWRIQERACWSMCGGCMMSRTHHRVFVALSGIKCIMMALSISKKKHSFPKSLNNVMFIWTRGPFWSWKTSRPSCHRNNDPWCNTSCRSPCPVFPWPHCLSCRPVPGGRGKGPEGHLGDCEWKDDWSTGLGLNGISREKQKDYFLSIII